MINEDFRLYKRKVLELYGKGEYQEALYSAIEAHQRFRDESDTAYWIACLQSLLNRKIESLQTLKTAVDRGIWWSPQLLQRETDFDNVRNEKEFREIMDRCELLFNEARFKTRPECLCFYPKDYDQESQLGLFIALHPYDDNASNFSYVWKKRIPTKGYLLAIPQSSQPVSNDRFCWDDFGLAKAEIRKHCRELVSGHNISVDKSIIAGWSQGGRLALGLALEESELNIAKVLLLTPAIKKADDFIPLLAAKAKNVRGYILTGDKDHFYPAVRELYDEMERLRLSFKMEVVAGLGHYLPENSEAYLNDALRFLNKE